MSDDQWRRNQDDDFGPPLFGDEPTNEHEVLSFDDDSGAMPHWTEPATGQVPRSEYSLPETIVSDETDDLAFGHVDTDVVERRDPGERLRHTVGCQQRHAAASAVPDAPSTVAPLRFARNRSIASIGLRLFASRMPSGCLA